MEQITGSIEQKRRYRAVQDTYGTASRELSHGDRCAGAVPELLRVDHKGGHPRVDAGGSRRSLRAERGERNPDPRARGGNPVEFAETFLQNYSEGQWINKERERLINAIDRVAGEEA
jgi:hypothetical protein